MARTERAPSHVAFRRLQLDWYGRLARAGFEDIEYGRENGLLKVANRENRGGVHPLEYESTLAYFSQAGEFLAWHVWDDDIHRSAWAMHADGASLREIAAAHGRSFKWAICLVLKLRRAMAAWRACGCPEGTRVAPGTQLDLPFVESLVRK